MTVPSTVSKVSYDGNNTTGPWAIPFYFKSDIVTGLPALLVTKQAADGTLTTLSYPEDFSITGVDDPAGGVSYTTVAVATGEKIIYSRNESLTQELELPETGKQPSRSIEGEFDRIIMIAQQLKEQIDRCVKQPISSNSIISLDTPVPNTALVYSADGSKISPGPTITQISNAQGYAVAAQAAAAQTASDLASVTAIASTLQYQWCGTAGGTSDALTLTPPVPITSYQAGQKFRFIGASSNATETPTVNVSGLGAKTITKGNGTGVATQPLAFGDIRNGPIFEIQYDGTQFQLMQPLVDGDTITSVTSAGTLVLNTIGGNFVTVTGNTAITAVTLGRGQRKTVRFTGTPLITNGASLVCPGGASIQVVAGDIVTFRRSGSIVYVEGYARMARTDSMSIYVPYVENGDLRLLIKSPTAFTITEVTTICTSGTATATTKINSTPLGGTANSVSSVQQSQAQASANNVAVGDNVTVTISANSSCLGMALTIKYTETPVQ